MLELNYENWQCAIAAKILTGDTNNAELLHDDLVDYLNEIYVSCECIAGDLSGEIIAMAVCTWVRMNPDKQAYNTAEYEDETKRNRNRSKSPGCD